MQLLEESENRQKLQECLQQCKYTQSSLDVAENEYQELLGGLNRFKVYLFIQIDVP